MASVRHRVRGDGSIAWQVLFRDDRSKPTRQSAHTLPNEKAAGRFKRLIEELGVAKAFEIANATDPGKSIPYLDEWCLRYIDHLTGVTDGTRKRYRRHVEIHLGALTHLPVDAITVDAIAAWVNGMSRAGLSGKTIANRHGFLSGALTGAVRAGHIAANPCDGTRLPKTERKEMVFLTGGEFARLLQYVRPDSQDLVTLLVATGLRWGEATALQPRDVDLDHGTLTVSRAWKWMGDGSLVMGHPKTRRSLRTIALPEQAAKILAARVADLKPEDLIFTNHKGDPWKEPAFHSAVWQPAVHLANGRQPPSHRKRAPAPPRLRRDGKPWGTRKPSRTAAPAGQELGKRPRIHDLRHTCASWMIRDGVPLPVIQRHLGHESITTTIDTYGHLEPEQLAMASHALGRALTNAFPQIEG